MRVQLALALRAERPADDEVLAQLRLALQEPAGRPSDCEVHRHIGDALRGRDDRLGALVAYVRAVTTAAAEAEEAAKAGLDLLSAGDRATLAANLRQEDVDALAAAVGASDTRTLPAALLAARAHRLRSDPSAAVAILQPVVDASSRANPAALAELALALSEAGRAEDALRCLDRLEGAAARGTKGLRAWALLDAGRFPEALTAANGAIRQDASALPVRALAMFAVGRVKDALRLVDSDDYRAAGASSKDASLAEAVIRLGAASWTGGSVVDEAAVQAADRAATNAARLDRATPDVLLVHGQVYLEGCLDVDRGRRLLARALGSAPGDIGRSRWLRFQRRARAGDEWFQYFETELAAAARDDDGVLAAAERPSRQRTAHAHDAAMAGLVAEVHRRGGRSADAAAAFEGAAASYAFAADLSRAVDAASEALALEPTPWRALDLAEYRWRWLDAASPPREEAVAEIDAALQAIDGAEDEIAADLVGRASVLRGLLLGKRALLATENRLEAAWLPVPWLLLGVLLDPGESYWAAHLAWALNSTPASRAARHFAERAIAINDELAYPIEAFLATTCFQEGAFDRRAERLAARYTGSREWLETLRLMSRLYAGRLDGQETIPSPVFDALWARAAAARATALTAGLGAAHAQLVAVREEALRPPADWLLAADMATLLGLTGTARATVEAGREAGEVSADSAAESLAWLDLVESDGRSGGDVAAAALGGSDRPAELLWVINVEVPLTRLLPGSGPGLKEALERLNGVARERLEAVRRLPPRPLGAEVRSVANPDRRRLIERLMELVEHVEARRLREAAKLARRMADGSTGLMTAGLRQLAAGLETGLESSRPTPHGP